MTTAAIPIPCALWFGGDQLAPPPSRGGCWLRADALVSDLADGEPPFLAQETGAALTEAGMPEALAREEVSHWTPEMRKAILKLYRSARNAAEEWTQDMDRLPQRGMVFWGDDDPFVPVETAERFTEALGVPLHRHADTGHWSVVEKADQLAEKLRGHWA